MQDHFGNLFLQVGSFLTSIDVWKGVGVSVIVTACTVVMAFWSLEHV